MTLKGRGKQKKSSLNPRTTPMNEFWWICFFLPPDNARSPRVTTVAWVVRECFPVQVFGVGKKEEQACRTRGNKMNRKLWVSGLNEKVVGM